MVGYILGLCLVLVFYIFVIGRVTNRTYNNVHFLVVFIILLLLTLLRNEDVVRDYSVYKDAFSQIVSSESYPVLFEPSFLIISIVINNLFGANDFFLFLFYAFIGIYFKLLAIKKLSNDFLLSVLIYISLFYCLQDLTQIRAGVASALFLFSLQYLYSGLRTRYISLVIVSILFHYSAVIYLPLALLSSTSLKKWKYLSFIILVYFLTLFNLGPSSLISLIPIPFIQAKIGGYILTNNLIGFEDINILSIGILFKCGLCIFFIVKSSYFMAFNRYSYLLIKIYTFSFLCLIFFSDLLVVAVRLNELLAIVDIILIPLLASIARPYRYATMIPILVCAWNLYAVITKILV